MQGKTQTFFRHFPEFEFTIDLYAIFTSQCERYSCPTNTQVEMGLTWIDHDTIDKPVEEISEGTAEAKDIEFKIETLKCSNSGSSSGVTSVTSSGPNRRESMITKKVCV